MTSFPSSPIGRPLRVAFLGTPPFAAECLRTLLQTPGLDVVGVVSAPDRPAGRGMHAQPSAVSALALEAGLPLERPERLRDPDFLAVLASWKPDIAAVVAFRMLPEVVFRLPQWGTINLHASLLPQLRGAAPIQWAILHGLEVTGVTTFSLEPAIDTGPLLGSREVPLTPEITGGVLHDRLLEEGKALLASTLLACAAGTLRPVAQDVVAGDTPLLDAPKFHKADTQLPLDRGVVAVNRTVRAFSPSPSAWTGDPGAPLKVLAGRPEPGACAAPSGTWRAEEGRAWIACSDGWYEVLEVKPTGKRAMAVKDWLNGHPAELAGGSE